MVAIPIDQILAHLSEQGYYHGYLPLEREDPAEVMLAICRSLGELYVPEGCDPAAPIIRTAPTRAQRAAPFDRPEAIGWHGDFATHDPDRPELSAVYVTRSDPGGAGFGAWRLASVPRVIARLQTTHAGLRAFELLREEPLPFSYADGEPTRWHLVLRPMPNGALGLRFYGPSIRRGCMAEYGEVSEPIAAALAELQKAADDVVELVPTRRGSLLVASNWFALHDRLEQTISPVRPNRAALLCFVSRQRLAG